MQAACSAKSTSRSPITINARRHQLSIPSGYLPRASTVPHAAPTSGANTVTSGAEPARPPIRPNPLARLWNPLTFEPAERLPRNRPPPGDGASRLQVESSTWQALELEGGLAGTLQDWLPSSDHACNHHQRHRVATLRHPGACLRHDCVLSSSSSTPRTSSTILDGGANPHDHCHLPPRRRRVRRVGELQALFDPQGGSMDGWALCAQPAGHRRVIETHRRRTASRAGVAAGGRNSHGKTALAATTAVPPPAPSWPWGRICPRCSLRHFDGRKGAWCAGRAAIRNAADRTGTEPFKAV